MQTFRDNINRIATVGTIVITIVFLVLFFNKSQPVEQLWGSCIELILTAGTLMTSFLMLIVVAFETDAFLDKLKEYRFHLGLGCLIASIFSAIYLITKFSVLLK